MNRKQFLKRTATGLLACSFLPFIKPNPPEYLRIGYMSVNSLPIGTSCGNWNVFDLDKKDWFFCKTDHCIQEADDKLGWIGGILINPNADNAFNHRESFKLNANCLIIYVPRGRKHGYINKYCIPYSFKARLERGEILA